MTKPRYQITLALDEIDAEHKDKLVNEGWTLINIWRLGVESASKIEKEPRP
jgi:hypothetical protein